MNNIKIVGFFLRPNKPELKKDFLRLKATFESFNIEVIVEKNSALMIDEVGFEAKDVFIKSDILISLGGDGTLLSTARQSFFYDKPIFPINAGNLGFLVDLKIDKANSFISNLVNGDYKIEKRRVLKVEFEDRKDEFALNDILVTNRERMKMSSIQVYADSSEFKERKLLNSYYGDALIISTPTGSTAYNLSSGGPILFPEMSSYILTPMAPHSLTQRPIVLPSRLNIYVGLENSDGIIAIDGQDIITLYKDTFVKVSVHDKPIQIIRIENYNFFDTLREKLKWGDEV